MAIQPRMPQPIPKLISFHASGSFISQLLQRLDAAFQVGVTGVHGTDLGEPSLRY